MSGDKKSDGGSALFWIVVALIFMAGTSLSSHQAPTAQLQPPPPGVTVTQPSQEGMYYSNPATAQQQEYGCSGCASYWQGNVYTENTDAQAETSDGWLTQQKKEIHAALDQAEALLTD